MLKKAISDITIEEGSGHAPLLRNMDKEKLKVLKELVYVK